MNEEMISSFIDYCSRCTSEEKNYQILITDFFNLFDIDIRKFNEYDNIASFQNRIGRKKTDFFWKGIILWEHKTLEAVDAKEVFAEVQEKYLHHLNEDDKPKCVVICDYKHWHIYENEILIKEFDIRELRDHIDYFSFLKEKYDLYLKQESEKEQMLEDMTTSASHDLAAFRKEMLLCGYDVEESNIYIQRLLLLLYLNDAGAIEANYIKNIIKENRSNGQSIGEKIDTIFKIIPIWQDKRAMRGLPSALVSLPHIEHLFDKNLSVYYLTPNAIDLLIILLKKKWKQLRPLIYGSIFQSCLTAEERHRFGAHFTSKENVLKVLNPLFLEDLRSRVNNTDDIAELRKIYYEIQNHTKCLDPACGTGAFLTIAFQELYKLEKQICDITGDEIHMNLGHFYGIELNPLACSLATISMIVSYHQITGKMPDSLPHIYCRNALTTDWVSVCDEIDYIFGNPPFIGSTKLSESQRRDLKVLFNNKISFLDYCTGWFKKADDYIQNINKNCRMAFVATSGIVSTENVAKKLFNNIQSGILFYVNKFKWSNGDDDEALVDVVILSLSTNGLKSIEDLINKKTIKQTKVLPSKKVLFFNKKCKRIEAFSHSPKIVENGIYMQRIVPLSKERIPTRFITNEETTECFFFIEDGTFFEYALVSSKTYWLWAKTFGVYYHGTAINIANTYVYNTFPIPELTEEQKQLISNIGQNFFTTKTEEARNLLDTAITEIYGFQGLSEEQVLDRLYQMYERKVSQ